MSAAEQVALVAWLRLVTAPFGARLTLHGAAELAREAGADGVHLPGGSDAVAARALLGPGALVGLSTHSLAEAAAADPAILDYITVSPVFTSISKPDHGPALGLDGLRAHASAARVPMLALGGVSTANAGSCRGAGAAGIAVMGGIMRAFDPLEETAGLIAAL